MSRPWARHGWGAAGGALLASAVIAISAQTQIDQTPGLGVASVLVGAAFASTSALLLHQEHQRGNALLFALLTGVWWLAVLTSLPVGRFTPAIYLFANQVDVVAAAALLRYPSSRLDRANRIFITVSAVCAFTLQAATLITSRPEDLDLPSMPWPHLLQQHGWSGATVEARSLWLSASALVFLVLLVRRWVLMAPLERRTLTPIVLTAAFVGLATTPIALHVVISAQSQQEIYIVRSYGAVAVGVAFVVSALQMRLARSALVILVNRLEAPSTAASVQSALREVLLDNELVVYFAVPESAGWYDDQGRQHELPTGLGTRMPVVTTTGDGRPLAAILVDSRLDRYRTLLDAAVTVSRFALENARLEAGLRAQLIAVREARARLLSAGLEQRRQLERDLHDGAQQRLLAIGLRLSTLETSVADDPETATAVSMLRKELHIALEELRDLARGIYPAVLSQAGLGPALEAITERLPVRVELHVDPDRRHPDVESAAYLVVCEALTNAVRYAGECTVQVDVHHDSSGLRVRVSDDGVGSESLNGPLALRGLRDRVAALGGEIHVISTLGRGTTVETVLPCA